MTRWVAPFLIFVVVGGSWVGSVIVNNRESRLLCEAVNANRSSTRNLLVSARKNTPKRQLTMRAKRFFRRELKKLQPLDCANFDRDSLNRLVEPQTKPKKKSRGGGAPAGGKQGPKQPP